MFDTVAVCPLSSISIGWVKCEGVLKVHKERHRVQPFRFAFITFNSKARTDYRDLSLKPITCGTDPNPDDACPRIAKILVDAQTNPTIRLHVTNGDVKVVGEPRYVMNNKTAGTFWARLAFDVEIPSAGDWFGRFVDGNDMNVWPLFTEVRYQEPPHCLLVEVSSYMASLFFS